MNSRQEKSAKRSCLFTVILVFVVIPFSLMVLALSLWFAAQASGSKQLKAKLANITKKGYPIDDASLDAFYKSRTDPTNTDAWLAILEIVNSSEFGASTEGVPYVGNVAEPPQRLTAEWKEEAAAMAFLEKWKPLSDELLRLSIDSKAVRMPIVFDSLNTDFKRTQVFRSLARILSLRSYVAARNRDSAGVRDAVLGMLGLSRAISGEPMLVSQLVSNALDGIAIGSLKVALKNDVLNSVDLQLLLPKTMELANIGKDWETAYAGERALALPVFTDIARAKAAGINAVFSNSRDAVFYIDLMERALEVPTEELTEFRARLQEVDSQLDKRGLLAKLDSLTTMQIAPAVHACGDAFIRRALQHRIASLAIVLRLHEDTHGKFPSTLDELTEIKKMESFSPSNSQRFGFRLEGSNAKLWGGSFRDAFFIPSEPPLISQEEPDTSGAEYWLWELPRIEKPK